MITIFSRITAPLALMICAGLAAASPVEAQDDAANAAANPATLGGEGTPIAIPMSNGDPDFGVEIKAYLEQAKAEYQRVEANIDTLPNNEREAAFQRLPDRVIYQSVPNRRFAGLTVIGVEAHWEGAAIIFKDPLPQVMAAFRANGLNIADDGEVPNIGGGYCAFMGDEYGAALFCG